MRVGFAVPPQFLRRDNSRIELRGVTTGLPDRPPTFVTAQKVGKVRGALAPHIQLEIFDPLFYYSFSY